MPSGTPVPSPQFLPDASKPAHGSRTVRARMPAEQVRSKFIRAQRRVHETLNRGEVVELQYDPAHPIDPTAFFREYVHMSVPVVIRGMAKEWPAIREWGTAASFLKRLGPDTLITVASTPNGRADAVTRVPIECVTEWSEAETPQRLSSTALHDDSQHRTPPLVPGQRTVEVFVAPRQTKMPAMQFFKRLLTQRNRCGSPPGAMAAFEPSVELLKRPIEQNEIVYAQCQNNCLFEEYAALTADVGNNVRELGEAVFGVAADAANVWVGSEHSDTTMHQDWYENLYAVVRGTKVFTLIPPWESTYVHKRKYYSAEYVPACEEEASKSPWAVAVDWREEQRTPWIRFDPTKPPDHDVNQACGRDAEGLRKATVLTVNVEAGDVLYLPATWFHHVGQRNDAEGKVIAVNYWFDMQWVPTTTIQPLLESMNRATAAGAGQNDSADDADEEIGGCDSGSESSDSARLPGGTVSTLNASAPQTPAAPYR